MFKHILVPTDGSDLSGRAVAQAIALAREVGGRITFFHVMGEPPFPVSSLAEGAHYDPERTQLYIEQASRNARAVTEAAINNARQAGVEAEFYLDTSSHPYEAIIRAAETRQCDLICMASHGRRGVNALLLGSETHKVLTHCHIPILVCR